MLQYIDDKLVRFWHIVLVGLCKLTGRDNFFFAIGSLAIANATFLIGLCAIATKNLFGFMVGIPLWACIVWISTQFADLMRLTRRSVTIDSEAMAFPPAMSSMATNMFCVWAVLFMLFVSLQAKQGDEIVLIGVRIASLIMPFMSISTYFAIDSQKPHKSMLRKSWDWLKLRKSSRLWGVVSPQPTAG